MESLTVRYNKIITGLILGLVGPWIGAFVFYLFMFNHKTIGGFIKMIVNNSSTHAPLLSVSLIFNLIFFYLFLRQGMYRAANGVIMAVFIYAPFVIYFKYV
tara:strand:- start:1489 stop:1791 length:303 start_codon:yes stop_codon:yes gene_type:complete